MLNITIIEGARGTGKSTVVSKIRQSIPEVTLINPTGFHLDGDDGLTASTSYYDSWMDFLYSLRYHPSNILFDRFYFSEQVFSKLYKSYKFDNFYEGFNLDMASLSHTGVKIDIILLKINNEEELEKRLSRDKVAFDKVEESVNETMRQQKEYEKLFKELSGALNIHIVDTDGKSIDEVYDEVIKIKGYQV